MTLKAQNLIAMISSEAGLDYDVVALHARRLREVGLFVKETRSPSSPRVQSRHVAHLLLMLLSEQPAAYAEKTIERAKSVIIDSDSLNHTNEDHFPDWPQYLNIFRQANHTFVDALEAMINVAIQRPHWFCAAQDALFCDTMVTFNRQEFSGRIDLNLRGSRFLGDDAPEIAVDLQYFDLSGSSRGASLSFSQENTIRSELFAAIGRAFAQGTNHDD